MKMTAKQKARQQAYDKAFKDNDTKTIKRLNAEYSTFDQKAKKQDLHKMV